MKFAGSNHYHEQIKWLYFGRNWNRNKGAGWGPTTENSNRRKSIRIDVNRFYCDVKQVLTSSEW